MSDLGIVDRIRLETVRAAAAALSVRHKSGAKPDDYLKAFLPIARALAYATKDDSWGEFEKEFSTIVCSYIDARLKDPTINTGD